MQFRSLWTARGQCIVTKASGVRAPGNTCSQDVLVKTGGPSNSFMNTGTSFFRNIAYEAPTQKPSTLSRSSVARLYLTLSSTDNVSRPQILERP